MVLGWTAQYLKNRYQVSPADHFGAWVAAQEFLEAMCDFSELEGIHVFQYQASPQATEEARAFAQLRSQALRVQPECFSLAELPEMMGRRDYVFLNHHISFQSFGRVRFGTGVSSVPLCCVVHTISTQPSVYIDALLYSESSDAVVVSSDAGLRTVTKLFEHAQTFLQARNVRSARRIPRLEKIPLGVNTRALRPRDRSMSRDLLGIPADRIVVLHLGRFSEEEKADLEPLMAVLSQLAAEALPVHLVLAGQDRTGEYSRRLATVARDRDLSDRVTLLPNFAGLLKPYILSAADLLVAPSNNIQETFGIALVEAMACGLPIVAADWSGYRDLILPGKTGLLVPTVWSNDAGRYASQMQAVMDTTALHHYLAQRTMVDAPLLYRQIRTLAENQDLRLEMGAAGRARAVKEYDWERIIHQYEQLWGEQSASAHTQTPAVGNVYDYNELFRHFATSVVDEVVDEYASCELASHLEDSQLFAESSEPVAIPEPGSEPGDASCTTPVQLLKKGSNIGASFRRSPLNDQ